MPEECPGAEPGFERYLIARCERCGGLLRWTPAGFEHRAPELAAARVFSAVLRERVEAWRRIAPTQPLAAAGLVAAADTLELLVRRMGG